MDGFDDIFDFDAFDNSEQNTSPIADNHLFNNGPDLFSHELRDTQHQAKAMPYSGNLVEPFADGTLQEPAILPSSDREYFDNTFELFQNMDDFGSDQTEFASLTSQPAPQPMAQQSENVGHGLFLIPDLPEVRLIPTPTIAPAALFNNILPYPYIVPDPHAAPRPGSRNFYEVSGIDQQQQWQVFADQQTQVFQPQPYTAEIQHMQAIQQWQIAENQLEQGLQSPFGSPINGQSPQNAQPSPNVQSSQSPHQAPNASQQQIDLSDEQIELLQNAEPDLYAQLATQEPLHHVPNNTASPSTTTPSPDEGEPSQDTSHSRRTPIKRTAHIIGTPISEQNTKDELLPQNPYTGLAFVSLSDAEAAMPSRYLESDWRAPSPDNTVPNTHRKRAEYVLMLLNALQDTSECKDNKNGFSFLKRWLNTGYYNVQEMEKVCWHMLDIAERLHTQGPAATNIYCQDAHKKLKASRGLTFEQRIVAICAMLKLSKHLCDNLLKGEGIETLVGAPKQKMSGAMTMMVQNQRRQKWITFGRTEDPLYRTIEEDSVLGPDEEETTVSMANAPESIKGKTKQKAKRSEPARKPRANINARSRTVTREEFDDEDEQAELLRRQSTFDNESDLDMAAEPHYSISSKPSSASPAPASQRRPSKNASSTSPPTFQSSLASAPALSPVASESSGLLSAPVSPASSEFSTKPAQPERAPFPQVRIPRVEIEAARTRYAEQPNAPKPMPELIADIRARQDARLRALRLRAEAAAKANTKTKGRSWKRAVNLTESDSEEEQPAAPTKRRRKTREATPRSSNHGASDTFIDPEEQDKDQNQESDQQASDAESANDENANDEEGDEDEEEDASEDTEATSPAPPPSSIHKRKIEKSSRHKNSKSTRPVAIANRPTKPVSKKSNKRKSQDEESEDQPALPAKRAKKGNNGPTYKPSISALVAKIPTKKGKKAGPLRDAQGRFVRPEAVRTGASHRKGGVRGRE